jgi:hypothetical protein
LIIVTARRLKLAIAAVALSSTIACASDHAAQRSFSPARNDLTVAIAARDHDPARLCTQRFAQDVTSIARTSESEYAQAQYDAAIEDAEILKLAVRVCSVMKGLWVPSATMYADDVLMKSYLAKRQPDQARRYSQEAVASARAVLADAAASRSLKDAATRVSDVAKPFASPRPAR